MAIAVSDVVSGVRDLHPAFDARLVVDAALFRFLSRYQRRLVYEVIRINPDVLLLETNIPYTNSLLMGSAGTALPAHLGVRSPGAVHFTADTQKLGELTLLKYQDRLSPLGLYPAFIRGSTLFLIGLAEDWIGVASIDVPYIPMPVMLTALANTFVLPDGALDAVVAQGGRFVAPMVGLEQGDVATFSGEADAAEQAFLRGLGTQHQAAIHFVKEAI